jgi:hypothetical protein
MSQVTIYMDDDAIARAKASAAAAKMSLSAWVSKLVKDQTPAVDAKGYPIGFFEEMSANAYRWTDFPLSEDIRATDVPDLPRETW